MLEKNTLDILRTALERLEEGFTDLPRVTSTPLDLGRVEDVLLQVADKLHDNFPYFHPLYAGQMLKPPHAVARLAYALALWINPNNHALDGGRASSAMEKEAVAEIAAMFGWTRHLGHLCSGGTMANLEALWVAGQIHPGKPIIASQQAHYTHKRISRVLGMNFEEVPCNALAQLDTEALERRLDQREVGTVVATIGTTATGSVDPLPRLLELRNSYRFRLHVDAAYGGYFRLASNLGRATSESYDRLGEVDSIVIDPHKHGLQPYGCGCVLFSDPGVGRFYKHDSPYTYFSSSELHLGEISLECSRPGAAAIALWATQKLFPLVRDGAFARGLSNGLVAARTFYEMIRTDKRFLTAFPPELDIVIWTVRAETATQASELARRIFKEANRHHLHLALAELPVESFNSNGLALDPDKRTVTCLRSVLMKPNHLEWIDRIWEILDMAANSVLQSNEATSKRKGE